MSLPAANVRPLYALYAANGISFAGNVLTNLAIPWFVLSTTGSAARTGITAAAGIVPVIIAGIVGGALVDRTGYKRMSVIGDLASGCTVALIAFSHLTGVLTFPLLLILVFLSGLLDAPGESARSALVPELAEAAGVTFDKASASMQVIERGSRLIAAPAAGVLIALISAVGLLWIDAATFVISAILVAITIPYRAKAPSPEPTEGYWSEMRAGFSFIRRDSLIFAIVATVTLTNCLDAARGQVAMPVLARDVYNSSVALGLIYAASGGGAVIGAILYARYAHRLARRKFFVGGFIVASVPILAYALLPPLWLVICLQVTLGIAAGPLNPIIFAVSFERVPENMRGRIFGALSACSLLVMPVGVLMGGLLIDSIGLPATFVIIGVLMLIASASLAINPAIRQLDDIRPSAAD